MPNWIVSELDHHEYDAVKLSKLLKECKGTKSITEFSKETGVSITYLTKLLHGNSPSRPSKKYLKRIAYPEHGIESNNVSYTDLLLAAGYSPEEAKQEDIVVKLNVPEFAKRKSFSIAFIIDNLSFSGEIKSDFNIQSYSNNDCFVIEEDDSKILCFSAIFENTAYDEKTQRVALNFLIALTTKKDIDKYYIITNYKGLADNLYNFIPKYDDVKLSILETMDYVTVSCIKQI